jgi:CHAT domain
MSDDSLLSIKRRRLNVLQLQAARYGIDTPPHVTIEIEDLTREIAALEHGKATVSGSGNQTTIGGGVTGTVMSGTFSGPVTVNSGSNPATPTTAMAAGSAQAETILAIFAEPRGMTATEWERETRELRTLLTPFSQRYRFQPVSHCTVEELYTSLNNFNPTMFHFQGHGTPDGIVLEDRLGDSEPVTWKALMSTLESCDTLTCVVLNACDSRVHAQVGPQRFHLITTPGIVTTEATRIFTQGFYGALLAGQSVPKAFRGGRNLLALKRIAENEWPILTEART